jgi:hypothetical protein
MKYIFLITIFATLLSCDHPATHDYYVKNECEQNIVIDIVDNRNTKSSITIKPSSKELIYHGETINEVYEDEITSFIKTIDIYKGGIKINIDPMEYQLWQYESNSKFSAISVLTVKPENFTNITDNTNSIIK